MEIFKLGFAMINLPKSLLFECDIVYEQSRDLYNYEKSVAQQVVKTQLIAAANKLYQEWLDSFGDSK